MKKLSSEIKRKINKMAHGAGVAHTKSIRSILFVEIYARLNNGETIAEMLEFLESDAYETAAIQTTLLRWPRLSYK